MEFNRRDLLKYFGAGAAIVPVVGGIAKLDAEAKLIQPAQVIPVAAPAEPLRPLIDMYIQGRVISPTLIIKDGERRFVYACEAAIITRLQSAVDVSCYGDGYRTFVPGEQSIDIEVRIRAFGKSKVEVI